MGRIGQFSMSAIADYTHWPGSGSKGSFLPLLCSLAYDPERIQNGPIEQGVFWALGRVGQPAAACSPEAVEAVRAAHQHPKPEASPAGRAAAFD
jgi:hypothetical protein